VGGMVRDLMMPAFMRMMGKRDLMGWMFDYRIDWDTPIAIWTAA
jgi:hypothetical protein